MPKVLLVSQPTTEGVAVCVAALARAAVADGWVVVVACPADGSLATWAKEAGAAWVDLPIARAPSPSDASAVAKLRPLIASSDLVHLHSSKAGAVGRAALLTIPRRRRPASVFTPHAWSWLVGGRLEPLYRWIERRLATVTDAIVAVSGAERDIGVSVLGRRVDHRIRLIPNGVDLTRFSAEGPAAERPAAPLVVCVGRLSHQKGQDIAIRSLARMHTPGARLRLVGRGPDETALRELAGQLDVADRVEFAGLSSEPAHHLRAADVVVVPSRWDGLSLSLLEALACGRPLVASRVAGTEAVDGAAVLVDPENPDQLADAVDRLLSDPVARSRLAAVARRRAEASFEEGARVAEVLAVWRVILRTG